MPRPTASRAADGHLSLAEALRDIRDRYDYIILDCPPRLSLVSFAAPCASDAVVIPLEAADWGAQGIVQVTAAVEHVRSRYDPDLVLLGYLVSRFKRARSYQRSYLAKLRQHFGPLAFDALVPDLARFEKSVTLGVPITLHAPASVEAEIARRLFAEVELASLRSIWTPVRESAPHSYSTPATICLAAANPSNRRFTSASWRWSSLTETSPPLRFFAPSATLALPSTIRGPVEYCHGRCFKALCRSFSRPSGVRPFRFARLRRLISDRLGLGLHFLKKR